MSDELKSGSQEHVASILAEQEIEALVLRVLKENPDFLASLSKNVQPHEDWLIREAWRENRVLFKAIFAHAMGYALIIGVFILLSVLIGLVQNDQRRELLEEVDFAATLVLLIMLAFQVIFEFWVHGLYQSWRQLRRKHDDNAG